MVKKIAYILIPASMTLSVAVAGSLSSDPVLLSSGQMDQVTAGLGAIVTVDAIGDSSFFAMTQTNGAAVVAISGGVNHPALGGYVEVAGGGAVAVAAGDGSTTDTNVAAATSQAGAPGSNTYVASGHMKGNLVEINSNVTYTSGSLFVNPF